MSDERVQDGLVHLQAAALEVIAAARAFLDVAEDLVRDPAAAAATARTAASVAAALAEQVGGRARGADPSDTPTGAGPAEAADPGSGAGGDERVRRIRLS